VIHGEAGTAMLVVTDLLVALWESIFLVAFCLWHFFKVRLKILFSSVLIKMRLNIASLVALFQSVAKMGIFSGIFSKCH
jgi:hypothetical protein